MRRRPVALFVLAFALSLSGSASGQSVEDEKASVDARIASLRAEIEESKQQEGVLTSQLSALLSELEDAQAAVGSAQASVAALESELVAARGRLEELTQLLARQTRALERLRAEHARAVEILEERVRTMYIEEPPDLLSFLVSAHAGPADSESGLSGEGASRSGAPCHREDEAPPDDGGRRDRDPDGRGPHCTGPAGGHP
jgi:hypothetical protein